MKIAIAVTSSEKDARVDTHGARAPFYLVLNTGSGLIEILPNPTSQAERGAGPRAAAFLSSKAVNKIIAEDFGPKFRTELEANNITCKEMTGAASEVVASLSD